MQIVKTFSFFSILFASSNNNTTSSNNNTTSSNNNTTSSNNNTTSSNNNMASSNNNTTSSNNNTTSSNEGALLKNEMLREIYCKDESPERREYYLAFYRKMKEDQKEQMKEYAKSLCIMFETSLSVKQKDSIKNFIKDLKAKLDLAYITSKCISGTESCALDSKITSQTENALPELSKHKLNTGIVWDPFISFVFDYNKSVESFVTEYADFIWKYISEKYVSVSKSTVETNSDDGSKKEADDILFFLKFMELHIFYTKHFVADLCKESDCNQLSDVIYIINYEILVMLEDIPSLN